MAEFDLGGLKPLDTSGLSQVPDTNTGLDIGGLKPLNTSGLSPVSDPAKPEPTWFSPFKDAFGGFLDRQKGNIYGAAASMGISGDNSNGLGLADDARKVAELTESYRQNPNNPDTAFAITSLGVNPADLFSDDTQTAFKARYKLRTKIRDTRQASDKFLNSMLDKSGAAFDEAEANRTEYGEDEWGKQFASDVLTAGVDMIPAIVASYIGGPVAGGSVIAGQVSGHSTYEGIRKEGLTPAQANRRSAFNVMAEAIPEMLPLKILTAGGGTSKIKKIIEASGAEGLQEAVTQIMQSGYDIANLGEDATWGDFVEAAQTPEFWKDVGYASLVGVGVGGTLAAVLPSGRGPQDEQGGPGGDVMPDLEDDLDLQDLMDDLAPSPGPRTVQPGESQPVESAPFPEGTRTEPEVVDRPIDLSGLKPVEESGDTTSIPPANPQDTQGKVERTPRRPAFEPILDDTPEHPTAFTRKDQRGDTIEGYVNRAGQEVAFRKRKGAEYGDILDTLAKAGGIRMDSGVSEGAKDDTAPDKGNQRQGFNWLFTNNGMTMDEAAEYLNQSGQWSSEPLSANDVLQMVQDTMDGSKKHYSFDGQEFQAFLEERELDQYAEEYGLDDPALYEPDDTQDENELARLMGVAMAQGVPIETMQAIADANPDSEAMTAAIRQEIENAKGQTRQGAEIRPEDSRQDQDIPFTEEETAAAGTTEPDFLSLDEPPSVMDIPIADASPETLAQMAELRKLKKEISEANEEWQDYASSVENPDIDHPTGVRLKKLRDRRDQIDKEMDAAALARINKSDTAPALELETQTEEGLAEQDRTRKEQKAQEEQKIRADEQLGDFTLAGSDSAVDQAEARGQQNLLDQVGGTVPRLETRLSKSDTSILQPVIDRVFADTDILRDSSDSQARGVKSFDLLDRDIQHMVISKVVGSLNDQKVLNAVIKAVPVDVMNVLIGEKITTQMLLDNPSMLRERLAVPSNEPIPQSVISVLDSLVAAVELAPAVSTTKEPRLSLEPVVSDLATDGDAAVEAERIDSGHVKTTIAGQEIEVNVNPTEAQKEAGVYKKGHINIQGLDITIENPQGSTRSGTDPDGKKWSRELKHHYGYIKRTESADGEQVDVFIGPNPESDHVFIVDQVNQDGTFDEVKVMAGFPNQLSAKKGYASNYEKGWTVGPITKMSVGEFKTWLKDGDNTAPVAPQSNFAEKPAESAEKTQVQEAAGEAAPQDNAGELGETKTTEKTATSALRRIRANSGELENMSAVDLADALNELYSERPRPLNKMFGRNPTEEQVATHRRLTNKYNAERSRLSKRHKKALERDNKAFREAQATETVTPSSDTNLGENSGGEQIYQRPDGSIYRMRFDRNDRPNGYPDFGGDLAVVTTQPSTQESKATGKWPLILTQTKAKTLKKMAQEAGIKQGSPGYDTAIARLEDQYETEKERALASISFEQYKELNPGQPESLLKQIHDGLIAEYGTEGSQEAPGAPVAEPTQEPGVEADADTGEQSSGRIDDFGEKIEGARKDTFTGFRDSLTEEMDVAAEPLSKSFPQPNYEKLAEGGVSKQVLAHIAILRNSIPNKPRKGYKLRRWAEAVSTARDLAGRLLSDEVSLEDVGVLVSDLPTLSNLPHTAKMLEDVSPADLPRAAKYRISSGSYSMLFGETFSPAKTFWFLEGPSGRMMRNPFSTDPAMPYTHRDNPDEVVDIGKKIVEAELKKDESAGPKRSKYTTINLYSDRVTKELFLGFKVRSSVIRLKAGFEDAAAARAYLEENRDELQSTIDGMRKGPNMRGTENRPRSGENLREGDVSPELFSETFGFRGVQFGNYVEGPRRQADLNRAYDALMDMADILDIPPQALSLNGSLGLAFGARGTGGPRAAAAHYEPGQVVINLTKGSGPGSLAHEWLHALDNYFAKQDDATGYMTERQRESGPVRDEAYRAWKDVESALQDNSFAERSAGFDKTRSKPYWDTTIEKAARSFERYIVDRLSEKGSINDYLANIDTSGGAYPTQEEMQTLGIRAAYDNLFNTLETRETEQGVALFSKQVTPAPAAGKGMTAADVQKIVDRYTDKLSSEIGSTITVVETAADLPFQAEATDNGAYYNGQVYLVANNIRNARNARVVLAHELVGHKGVLEMSSRQEWEDIKSTIQGMINRGNKTAMDIMEEVYARYPETRDQAEGGANMQVRFQEFIAVAAERRVKRGTIGRLLAKIKGIIRRFLNRIGIHGPFSEAELDTILENSERYLREVFDSSTQNRRRQQIMEDIKSFSTDPSLENREAEVKGLDMSREARLKRAREMGFDTDTVWYHVTDREIDQFNVENRGENTLGNASDPAYGATSLIGSWFNSQDISTEDRITDSFRSRFSGTVTYPVFLPSNLYEMGSLDSLAERIRKIARERDIDIDNMEDLHYDIMPAVNEFVGSLESQGFKGVLIRDEEFGGESVAVFDPANIRSVNAAFDPDYVASSNLLASSDARPLVYHGTDEQFEQFSEEFFGEATGIGDLGDGFYFTDKEDVAKTFGNRVIPARLDIRNPATNEVMMDAEVQNALDDGMGFKTVQEVLEEKGYDSIIYTHKDGTKEYVVFSPDQIDQEDSADQPLFSKSPPDKTPVFEDEESELRWQEARKGGKAQESLLSDFSRRAQRIADGFTRHYINLPNEARFSDAREQLRKIEAAPQMAKDEAIRKLKKITEGLSRKELDLFTRKVVLDDLSYEVDVDHELPFKFSPEKVKNELAKIDTYMATRPDILKKIKARQVIVKDLANGLVSAGVLSKDRIKNPAYYRHQVLDYARSQAMYAKGSGKKLKTPKWARRMGSSLDINANLLEAEFEWMQKALTDIAVADTIKWIRNSNHNIREQLTQDAKKHNEGQVEALLAKDLLENGYTKQLKTKSVETSPMNEEWAGFKQRIAIGLGKVRAAIKDGDLNDIPPEFSDIAVGMESGSNEGSIFPFLAWILDNNKPGSDGASQAFKAMNQRKAWVRNLLGRKYADPMNMESLVKQFAPEGYKVWQPDDGNLLFTAKTIPEHVIDRMIAKISAEGAGAITAEEMQGALESVRTMFSVGGPKYQMVLPEELADTLNSIKDVQIDGLFDELVAVPLAWWKRWVLINPRRVLKYNLNNLSGDLDALIAGNPRAATKLPKAISELWNVMHGKEPSDTYRDATERAVFDSGLSIQEIPDINYLDEFSGLTNPVSLKEPGRLIATPFRKIWNGLQDYTRFRENWLRYAAYLDYLERLESGESMKSIGYGASRKEMVDAVTDNKDKAALLARDLVGDYGAISHFGKGIRRKLIPFYSWMEINTKRYWRFGINAYDQGIGQGIKTTGIIGAILGIRVTAYLTMRMAVMYGLIQLWNNMVHGDDEDELPAEEKVRLHLILGKDDNGDLKMIRFQGALSDFLGWIGFDQAVGVASEIEKGRAGYKDLIETIVKAPVNKIVSGITPVISTPVETLTGYSYWPDVFEPRSIRDKWRHTAQLFSLENEYDWLYEKPTRGYGESIQDMVIARRNLGENAYNRIRGLAYDWERERTGSTGSGSYQTPRSKALYEWRLAKRYGDHDAEVEALRKMRELGMSSQDRSAAINRAEPLGPVAKKRRRAFELSLTPQERELLLKAEDWYEKTYRN